MSHETIQTYMQEVLHHRLDVVKLSPNETSSNRRWSSIDHIVEAYCRYWCGNYQGSLVIATGYSFFENQDPYSDNIGLTILSNPNTCRYIAENEDKNTIQTVKNLFGTFLFDPEFANNYSRAKIHVYNVIRAAEGLLQIGSALSSINHIWQFPQEKYVKSAPYLTQLALIMHADDPDLNGSLVQKLYNTNI